MKQAIQPITQTETGPRPVVNKAPGLTQEKVRNDALTKFTSEAPPDNMPVRAKNYLSTNSLPESIIGGSPVVNKADGPAFTDNMPVRAKNYLQRILCPNR